VKIRSSFRQQEKLRMLFIVQQVFGLQNRSHCSTDTPGTEPRPFGPSAVRSRYSFVTFLHLSPAKSKLMTQPKTVCRLVWPVTCLPPAADETVRGRLLQDCPPQIPCGLHSDRSVTFRPSIYETGNSPSTPFSYAAKTDPFHILPT
jgi:hypothetical protein